jgi:hypothetical protein
MKKGPCGALATQIVSAAAASVIFASVTGCVAPRRPSSGDTAALFVEEVKPILERNCLRCHNGSSPLRTLDLRNRALAFASTRPDGRPFIIPGQPDRSLIITAVSRQGTHPKLMPRQPVSLTDMDIGVLRDWISAGAGWPSGPDGELHAQPNPENP